jgi:hypothetical protein
MTVQDLLDEVERLPVAEKWRLVNHVLSSLERTQTQSTSDWHQALRETYGILANDPIERPPQLPLQDREPIE